MITETPVFETPNFVTTKNTEIYAWPGARCGIFNCRKNAIEYEAPPGAFENEIGQYSLPPDEREKTLKKLRGGSPCFPSVENYLTDANHVETDTRYSMVYSKIPKQLKVSIYQKPIVETIEFEINWDGTVRADIVHLTTHRPTPDERPLIASYLKEIGVEWVDYSAMDELGVWRRQYSLFRQKYLVSKEREAELLQWLYSQGWEQHPPADNPVEVFYVPISRFYSDYECAEKPTIALVAAYTEESAAGWRKIEQVEIRSSRGWGPGTSVIAENLPLDYDKSHSRQCGDGVTSNEMWKLLGCGRTRMEADAMRERFEKLDKVSGTGAILLPGVSAPGTNIVG